MGEHISEPLRAEGRSGCICPVSGHSLGSGARGAPGDLRQDRWVLPSVAPWRGDYSDPFHSSAGDLD